jgi:L-ascorbate metabolism protein UlaG (beta-lactamase superfamily)
MKEHSSPFSWATRGASLHFSCRVDPYSELCKDLKMNYKVSDHCDGKKFFNLNPNIRAEKSFLDFLKWMATRKKVNWPDFFMGRQKAQFADSLNVNEAVVTFINHATLLLQVQGFNFLTDPVFSDRVSPLSWLGPRRVREPGLKISELPKIDFVLLSHNHYDHLDLAALKGLKKLFNPKIIAPLGNEKYFRNKSFENICEIDWWDSIDLTEQGAQQKVKVTSTPAQHWSSRSPFDLNKTLWGGFVLEAQDLKIFFAGDTGYDSHFESIFAKFGAMDISLLPIGSYEPQWFMKVQHMNPREAVQAHLDLKSQMSIGIHFGCFRLTDEGIHEPQKELDVALLEKAISAEQFKVPDHGQSFFYKK